MSDLPSDETSLVEVGRYSRLSLARERALVVSAMELPHCVEREGRAFLLKVEPGARGDVLRELEKFEAEQQARVIAPEEPPLPKLKIFSLYVAAWLLAGFYGVQQWLAPRWEALGCADSVQITQRGEWWRAATALTLHGDFSHLAANLASGLLFCAFLLPRLGTGITWLAVVLSGVFGNLLNAIFYHRATHLSIGASTAVFGALGILVGSDFATRFSTAGTRSRWQLVLPIGAGFALLAFLGTGGEDDGQHSTDYMAHLWGLLSGLALGAGAAWSRIASRTSPFWQRSCACLAPALLLLSWWLAWKKEN